MNVPGKDVGHGVVVNQHHFCDLLIIKKGLKKGREIVSSIYRAFLHNEIGVPVDLLAIDYNRYILTKSLPYHTGLLSGWKQATGNVL